MKQKKVLFFAEAATLAHLARPYVLATSINPGEFDITLARAEGFEKLFPESPLQQVALNSIPSQQFLAALRRGKPLYDADTLTGYVEEDLELIKSHSPDVIVGDFRLSLSVSARLAGIPYISIANAYWSPFTRQRYPIPEHPLVKYFGVPIAEQLFNLVRPLVFAYHTLPLNRVRKKYGLKPLGLNLGQVYTDADHVVFTDIPNLVETKEQCDNHHYIGPVLWSPDCPLPAWWGEIRDDLPVIYVALGSSGRNDLLPQIVGALKELPLQLMVSTAGQQGFPITGRNVFVSDFLPGKAASDKSNLVICNGGSLTCYQAVKSGAPFIGVSGNLDQHLNMQAFERLGVGIRLRTDSLNAKALLDSANKLLQSKNTRDNIGTLQNQLTRLDPVNALSELIKRL